MIHVVLLAVLAMQPVPIEATTMQTGTVTVTGPITGTPVFLGWEPGTPSPDHVPLDDVLPTIDIVLWLSIAWYWVKNHWLDNRIFGYWLIYQFMVAVLGNNVGHILSRGSFFRLLAKNQPPDRDPVVIEVEKEPDKEEEKT